MKREMGDETRNELQQKKTYIKLQYIKLSNNYLITIYYLFFVLFFGALTFFDKVDVLVLLVPKAN